MPTFSKDAEVALQSAVKKEQAKALALAQPASLSLNCVLALTSSISLYSRSDAILPTMWLGSVALCTIARLVALCWYRIGDRIERNPEGLKRAVCAGAAVSGLIWAVLPLTLEFASVQAAILMFTISGITAGAAIQSVVYAPVCMAFTTPILSAVMIKLFNLGGFSNFVFGINILIYYGLIFTTSRNGQAHFENICRLRLESDRMAMTLALEVERSHAAVDGLNHIAKHDNLTGLANRAAFQSTLQTWLERFERTQVGFSLVLADIDRFKDVNDSFGHAAGDEVLSLFAERLSAIIRRGDFVARLGGDEFAILVADDGDGLAGRSCAERLVAAAGQPYRVAAGVLASSASIGVANLPGDRIDGSDLLVAADLALYSAKEAGRRRWHRFDAGLRAVAHLRRDIEQDMSEAMRNGDLQVWYQPQVELDGERLIGLEALLRWVHPRHGPVSPVEMVAAASRLNQSHSLTAFVIENACRMIKTLEGLDREDVVVSINVSPREIGVYDLPSLVASSLDAEALAPGKLEIEITEEALVESRQALETLARLTTMGVRLAIDDFGTGCASIAYLRHLTVNRIKIDRSFVSGLGGRAHDRILVEAIVGIGRSFGVEVMAEGIETAEEALILLDLGCKLGQGYQFGKAMSSNEILAQIEATAGARWRVSKAVSGDPDRRAMLIA